MKQEVKRRNRTGNPLGMALPAADKIVNQAIGVIPLDEGQEPVSDTQFNRAVRIIELVRGKVKPVQAAVKFTIKPGSDLLEIIQQLMAAVAQGKIAPDVASGLIAQLNHTNRAIISTEMRDALEEMRKQMEAKADAI